MKQLFLQCFLVTIYQSVSHTDRKTPSWCLIHCNETEQTFIVITSQHTAKS